MQCNTKKKETLHAYFFHTLHRQFIMGAYPNGNKASQVSV